LKPKIRKRLFRVFAIFIGIVLLLQGIRHFFGEEERQIRSQLRETVLNNYPDASKQLKNMYGLRLFHASQTTSGQIILIHGLDEPGKVWMNLAPELAKEGYSVWIMTYPNDQPVSKSAHLFFDEIESIRMDLKHEISIIGHSMGGLVSREMLTSPEISYTNKATSGDLPRVKKLIMVGTPNHGSELARLHMFTEIRDQFVNLFKGNYHWLQGILDGAGEAGIDLIPGSEFLNTLNARPHPDSVDMTVIAGIMTPVQKSELKKLDKAIQSELQGNSDPEIQTINKLFHKALSQAGDGAVSLESAKLEGTPLRIVQGTHLSMIRNIMRESDRIPPSLPVIVNLLKD